MSKELLSMSSYKGYSNLTGDSCGSKPVLSDYENNPGIQGDPKLAYEWDLEDWNDCMAKSSTTESKTSFWDSKFWEMATTPSSSSGSTPTDSSATKDALLSGLPSRSSGSSSTLAIILVVVAVIIVGVIMYFVTRKK